MEPLDFKDSYIRRILIACNPKAYEYYDWNMPSTTCSLLWVLFGHLLFAVLFFPVFFPLFLWNYFTIEDNHDNLEAVDKSTSMVSFVLTIAGFSGTAILAVVIEKHFSYDITELINVLPLPLDAIAIIYTGLIFFIVVISIIVIVLFCIFFPFFYIEEEYGWNNMWYKINPMNWQIVGESSKEKKPNALFEAIKAFKDKTCKPIKWSSD